MTTTELFYEIENEFDVKLIETTTGRNGYPQNLKKAIIGFDSFEECEEVAYNYPKARITTFHKRDGWQLWERTSGTTYGPLENSADDYGDDFNSFTKEDADDYFENEVKEQLENYDDFDSMRAFLDEQEEVLDEINKLDDNEMVITHCGRYYETIYKESMFFYHDTHHYAVGIIID
jgi:hypothetical protein